MRTSMPVNLEIIDQRFVQAAKAVARIACNVLLVPWTMGISGKRPLSMAKLGGGAVGPAGRDCAGACAFDSSGEPTAATPATVAPFSKLRLLSVESLRCFDIASSRLLATFFISY